MIRTIERIRTNKIKCRKCGDILQSKYRHDFQMCKCGSCYIDGGNDYCRVGGKKEDIEWIDREEKRKSYETKYKK